jgi:hypothetical protein
VPPDTYVLQEFQATATIHTGPARPTVLELAYQGTEPPLALFTTLQMVGVDGLVPQPPPSSAIDWGAGGSTPTIRPFPAVARVALDGPDRHRERVLDAVRLVVERLSRTETAALPPPPSPAGAPSPGAPPPPAPSAASHRPPPPVAPLVDPSGPRAPGRRLVVVVADEEVAPDIRRLVGRHGELLDETSTTWTSQIAYRGQKSETHHRAVRFRATIADEAEDGFLAELSRHRLRSLELKG